MDDLGMDAGLDRHDWETEWADIEDLLEDDPGEGLPAADELIERMMVESGFPTDTVAEEGVDPEITATLAEARRVTAAYDAGEDVSAADTIAAAAAYRDLYTTFLARGPVTAPVEGDVEADEE